MSDYMTEEVVAMILKYLPVKGLMRFRCVCRGWKELIESPTFLYDHLAVQNPRFIVGSEGNEFLSVDPHTHRPLVDTLIPPIATARVGIFGTLHGVVCLTDWETKLLIWNPSIHKSFTLTLPDDFQWDNIDGWRDCYGFWIDPSNKEFKILMLLFLHAFSDDYVVPDGILYSSIRNDWRVIPPEDLRNWRPNRDDPPVMIGELAHWAGWYVLINDQGHEHAAVAILSFDFKLERFEIIATPSNSVHPVPYRWKGTLSLLCCDDSFPRRCDIYSRQEGSWVKMFGLDLFAPTKHVFWLLEGMGEMQENGRVLATIGDEMVIYDAKTSCTNPLKGGLLKSYPVKIAYDFVESLLFP